MARTAAAMATASRACCGTVDSGSDSRLAAAPVALAMADPAGRSAVSPGGTPPGPPAPDEPGEVASHHCVTWAAASELLVSTSCRRPRSTMRAPLPADAVGNVVTAATIFTLMIAPLTSVCTTEPTLELLAARKRCVAMPGSTATGGVPVRVRSPLILGQPEARVERHRQRAGRRGLGRDGRRGGRPVRAEGLLDAGQLDRGADGGPAAQHGAGLLSRPRPGGEAGQGEGG